MEAVGGVTGVEVQAEPYLTRFAGVVEADGEFGPQFKWIFQVIDGPCKGRRILGWCDNVPPTQANKLGRWLGAMVGKPTLPPGEKVNTDDYVNCVYRVWVKLSRSGAATIIDRFERAPEPEVETPF